MIKNYNYNYNFNYRAPGAEGGVETKRFQQSASTHSGAGEMETVGKMVGSENLEYRSVVKDGFQKNRLYKKGISKNEQLQ